MSKHHNQPSDADNNKLTTKTSSTNTQRRLVLGGAVGATALAWQTPVVKSIVLPAHAQTSVAMSYFAAAAAVSPITNVIPSIKSPLDLLVEPAVAQMAITSEYTVGIASVSGDTYQVDVFERQLEGESNVGEFLFSGQLTLGASGTLAIAMNPCEADVSNITATLAAVSADSATLNLTSRGDSLMVPAGNGTVPMPMCVDTGLPEAFFIDNFPVPGGDLASSNLLDLLIPEAHAGVPMSTENGFRILATKLSENEYAISHLNRRRNVLRQGNLRVDGTEGRLDFIEDACADSEGEFSNIPASIVSVDSSEMVLELQLGNRGNVLATLPVGSGMVMAECNILAENLTSNRGLIPSVHDKFGDSLLDMIVPPAQAGGIIVGANVVINATNMGNGNFDLQVGVLNEGFQQIGLDATFLVDGILTGRVSAMGGSVPLTNVEGCEYNLSASATVASPNSLEVSLTGDVVSDFRLREGTTLIGVLDSECTSIDNA